MDWHVSGLTALCDQFNLILQYTEEIHLMLNYFIDSLKRCPKANDVFNPWWEVDEENDIGEQAPSIRKKQLIYYLYERLGIASVF